MLASIFLGGMDKHGYKTMINDLNNSYLASTDNYPASVDTVLTMMTHYQNHASHLVVGDSLNPDRGTVTETSFTQRAPTCFCCGKIGTLLKIVSRESEFPITGLWRKLWQPRSMHNTMQMTITTMELRKMVQIAAVGVDKSLVPMYR